MIRALLWDVDGTLAETERDGHRIAFNQAFEACGVPWRWSETCYGELLAVAGGRERLLYDMRRRAAAPATEPEREALAAELHRLKNECYAAIIARRALPLRAGVAALLADCRRAGMAMAIVTTTSRCNVEALLAAHLGGDWAAAFATVVCAEQAPRKKPDPQAYGMALEALRLAPQQAIALEDAPAGLTAAQCVGLPVVVTRSHYFRDFPCPGALAVGPSLGSGEGWRPQAEPEAGRIGLEQLRRWHDASRWCARQGAA